MMMIILFWLETRQFSSDLSEDRCGESSVCNRAASFKLPFRIALRCSAKGRACAG